MKFLSQATTAKKTCSVLGRRPLARQREGHALAASEPGLQADQAYDSATMPLATWWARPIVVIIGLTPDAPGKRLLSATKTFAAPRRRPPASHAARSRTMPTAT